MGSEVARVGFVQETGMTRMVVERPLQQHCGDGQGQRQGPNPTAIRLQVMNSSWGVGPEQEERDMS